MANIKNMGTATMKFGEGAIVTGSYHDAALTISGSLKMSGGSKDYSFPLEDGSADQILTTDGDGSVIWANPQGGINFIQGHVEVSTTAKPVNFQNVVSIGGTAAANIKSWLISPFAGKIKKIILSVKSNNFSTSNDGNITLNVYKNQASFGATAGAASIAADAFTQTVNNFEGASSDLNTGTFITDVSIAEGDLIQIKAGKSTGDDKDAVVTVIIET